MKIQPLNKFVLVQTIKQDEKKGSLYLPVATVNSPWKLGKVVSKSMNVSQEIEGKTIAYMKRGVVAEIDGMEIISEDSMIYAVQD